MNEETAKAVILAALHNYGLFAGNVVQCQAKDPPKEQPGYDVWEFYRKCRDLGPLAEPLADAIRAGSFRIEADGGRA